MRKDSKIAVLGASGLVGGAILRNLIQRGYKNLIGTYKSRRPDLENVDLVKVDLTHRVETEDFFQKYSPEYVFLAAAKVGGILANNTYKADFIYENLAIAVNVLHSAYKYGVRKLLNLGSSCIYPKLAPQPMKEEYLLTGSLEPTNEPYAIAKISAIKLCRYYNEQYGTNFISVMPTNLYGPGDNFNLETSHVIPALIRKFHLAKLLEAGDLDGIKRDLQRHPVGFGLDGEIDFQDESSILQALKKVGVSIKSGSNVSVAIWGSGEVYREFLYVDDLADACIYLMENVDAGEMRKLCEDYFLNVGTGEDIKLKDLAVMIREIVGAKCGIVHDMSKPDGTPKKLLDVSKINRVGWRYRTSLEEGIRKTYEWYLKS